MINQTKIFKFIIPIVVFILLYAVSTIRNNNVRKDGIYSIVTLVKYSSAYRGQSAKYEFVYNKTLYKGSFLYHLPRVKTLNRNPLLCNILSKSPRPTSNIRQRTILVYSKSTR